MTDGWEYYHRCGQEFVPQEVGDETICPRCDEPYLQKVVSPLDEARKLDLGAIRLEQLRQCGPHDFGLVEHKCNCPSSDPRPVIGRLCDEVERLTTLLEEERLRWKARVHEAVDECQKRYASVEGNLAKLTALLREVSQRHGDEMEAQGQARWSNISYSNRVTLAAILLERDEALTALDKERRKVEKLTQTIAAFPDANNAANIAHARAQRDTALKEVEQMRLALALHGGGIDPEGFYADTPGSRVRELFPSSSEE